MEAWCSGVGGGGGGVTARKGGVKEAFPSLCYHRNYIYKRTFFYKLALRVAPVV